ncbi:MAG: transporter associated domain-containing protein [Pseudomonadota bacterium]|nr:transporter associated domain-containing protein [Pseudomonadota bacterium]
MTDDASSSFIGRWFRVQPKTKTEMVQTIHDCYERGVLDIESLSVIEGTINLAELRVRDVMIPRSQVVCVSTEQRFDSFMAHILESAHSRFPVFDDSDEVIGILIAKDLLRYISEENKPTSVDLRKILRPANIVPESKTLDTMLQDFRANRNHMMIVVDEYGEYSGIITIEDVLEQIVGEIEDEHDIEEDDYVISSTKAKEWIVKPSMPLEDFNDYFDTSFQDERFDTIGGLVTHFFGHLPRPKETVSAEGFRFTIMNATSRRIRLMRVEKLAD